MATHTPGPWRVEEGTTLIWGACDLDDNTTRGMGYPIADARTSPAWFNGDRPSCGEGEANARIIAAAPDLLESLEASVVVLEECANILRPKFPSLAENVIGHHIREARAAIAKAKGEA